MNAAPDVAAAPKGRGRLKREATEAELVEAFGRVVRRHH